MGKTVINKNRPIKLHPVKRTSDRQARRHANVGLEKILRSESRLEGYYYGF